MTRSYDAPVDTQPSHGRIALRIEQDTPCPDCGYNLRGMRLDARCPECGRPTIDTFSRPLGAGDGEFAERLVRRPAGAVLGLAAVGFFADALAVLPATRTALAAALVVVAGDALLVVLRGFADVRQARGWDVGSAVEDVAGHWRAALLVAALAAVALPAAALWGGAADFPTSAAAGALFGVASLALLAALALGGTSVATLLKRFSHGHDARPLVGVVVACAAVLLASAAVPILDRRLAVIAGVGGLVGLAGLLVSWLVLVNRLRVAQGSIASLGRGKRQRRATTSHELPHGRR